MKEWNLGESCLYNPKTKAAYRAYLKTDDVLRKEIESKLGADPVLLTESVEVADSTEGDDEEEDDCDELTDATEIPLATIIQAETGFNDDMLRSMLIPSAGDRFCVSGDAVRDDSGVFVPSDCSEDIWAYRDDGTLWGEELPA